jgi:DNA primase
MTWASSLTSAAVNADAPGRAAAVRALELLTAVGANPGVAELPNGSDPAQVLVEHGSAELRAALTERAQPLVDQVVEDRVRASTERMDSPEGRLAGFKDVLPLVVYLPGGQSRGQLARLAERCGVEHGVVVDATAQHLAARDMGEARRAAHDRRDDLDRGQFVAVRPAAAAGVDYPTRLSPRRTEASANGSPTHQAQSVPTRAAWRLSKLNTEAGVAAGGPGWSGRCRARAALGLSVQRCPSWLQQSPPGGIGPRSVYVLESTR